MKLIISSTSSSIVKSRTVITAFGVLAVSASAATVDWNASGSPANWSATSSWLGGVLPGTGDIARFNMTAAKTMTLDSSQSIVGFQIGNGSTAAGALTVSLSAGQGLTLGAAGLTMLSGTAAATFSGSGNLTLGVAQAWSNFSSNTLTISSSVVNSGNLLSLFGSGNMTFSGTSALSGAGGLYNQNWNFVTLAGANTYTGTTTIGSFGTTVLDFNAVGAPADNIINNTANSSGLAFNGMGILQIKGNTATHNQQFNGLTLNRGGATITGNNVSGAGVVNVSLGGITRNNSSAVDFVVNTLGSGFITTSATNDAIIEALRRVHDPELHKDLVSLNMIKDVKICGGDVLVAVELTTPARPLKDRIRGDVVREVSKVPGVARVNVDFSARNSAAAAADPFANRKPLAGVKNVIAVGAGKGGVGKSTVATLLAYGLAAAGQRVGLMDADIYGPSIPKMLGLERAEIGVTDQDALVPVDRGGIQVMSVGFLVPVDRAIIWRGPMAHGLIQQFLEQVVWGELDYLIVDLPPGTGDVPLTLAQTIPVTGAVVVCTPQDVALADAVRALRMYEALKIDILGIVENMSYFIAPDTGKKYDLFGEGGAAKAARALRVPFLGSLPINIQIRVSGDEGTPEKLFAGQHPDVQEAIRKVIDSLTKQVDKRRLLQAEEPEVTVG